MCDALGSYLVEFRCVGESSNVFIPISRISKVKGYNNSNSLDHRFDCYVNAIDSV